MSQEHKDRPTEVVVDAGLEGRRLDAIAKISFDLSWNKARDWVQRGKVSVDGQVVLDGSLVPALGAHVVLQIDAPAPRPEGQLGRDAIMYADRHVVVVNKPSGLLTVPFDDGDRGTLVQQLRFLLPREKTKGGGGKGNAPGLFVVHRLDKATSGVMLFARTARARDGLSQQFREHSISRRYMALAHGVVASTTYRTHLLKNRGDGMRGSREHTPFKRRRGAARGKLSITHVKALEVLDGATLIACRLETGRTNQIRIHLAEVNHPLVGETVYNRDFQGPEIPASRLMLHAAELGFFHPVLKEEMFFETPLTEDMQGLVERLRKGGK